MSSLLTETGESEGLLSSVLKVDTSSSSLQDLSPGSSHQQERSNSLPRLTHASSPAHEEVVDSSYEEITPTPGDPITPVSPVNPVKPSPELEETIREEIDCSVPSDANHRDEFLADEDSDSVRTEFRVKPSNDFSPAQKQQNPSLKPPIPARPQQQQSSYFSLYHKKRTFQADATQSPVHSDPSSRSSLSKKMEIDSILPNKMEGKKRPAYENVPLSNTSSSSGRPVRRRVDLTRSLNHTQDEELEDVSVFNDTSESVFSLSPSLGVFRCSAGSGVMDTSALSQLSLSPQESKKHSPLIPSKGELEHRTPNHKINSSFPYEASGVTPMDCSPREKISRSPSYSPSGAASEATRVYTKGFSPSKAVKLAAKKSPVQSKPAPPPADPGTGQKGVFGVIGFSPTAFHSPPKQSSLPASPSRAKHPPLLKDVKPSLETLGLEEETAEPLLHPEDSFKDAMHYLDDEDW